MGKENDYGNISSSAKRFKRHQDKGGDESDKTPVNLLWWCGCSGYPPLYFHKRGNRHTGIRTAHGAVMLPFFFLAMYEKDGFPAEKILYFMIRQKILTPGIRPYKSENIYRQLEKREKIEKEVRYLEEKAAGKTTR